MPATPHLNPIAAHEVLYRRQQRASSGGSHEGSPEEVSAPGLPYSFLIRPYAACCNIILRDGAAFRCGNCHSGLSRF
jgi:hypothetical protein